MSLQSKRYDSYQEYIEHQKSKAPPGGDLYARLLGDLWEDNCAGFRKKFLQIQEVLHGKRSALCLGARTGEEVFVLSEMGIDSIGIDLHPCLPRVIEGDVHNLPFPDLKFDFVFSNIFDHVLYPKRFLAELDRVLMAGGHGLLHLSVCKDEGVHPDADPWASTFLSSSSVVREMLSQLGDYEFLADEPLRQENWPSYWTLLFRKAG